jgi:hypothetical protein
MGSSPPAKLGPTMPAGGRVLRGVMENYLGGSNEPLRAFPRPRRAVSGQGPVPTFRSNCDKASGQGACGSSGELRASSER